MHVYLLSTTEKKVVASHEETAMTTKTTAAFQVPEGTYGLVVVANPTTALNDLGAVDDIFDFTKLIESVTEAQAKNGYNSGTFLMTTAFNEVDYRLPSTATILSSNDKDSPAKATASVDRAAVKIVDEGVSLIAKGDAATDAVTKSLIENGEYKGFVLINGNEKFNLFQKWENLTVDVEGKALITPQGKIENKVMTGYYNPITKYGNVDDNGIYDNLTDLNTPKNTVYTTENRPDFMFTESEGKITSGMANTTGLIYQVIAKVSDGASGFVAQTFYSYRNEIYTTAEEITKLKEIKELKDLDWTNAPALRKAGVKVYEDGKMYYTYYIQDQNYKIKNNKLATAAEVNYNAVMRNAVYKIAITGLNDLGDDVPGGGKVTPENPNPPIETDKTYLQVTVEVNDWVLNEINTDL